MSNIRVEMFPASQGDCILISLGGQHQKINILIDGGFKETYYKFLKPRLIELKNMGESLDLLVVTHIDEDHIEGIIELIKDNGPSTNPLVINIKEIWHNSYRHLQFFKEKSNKIDENENEIVKGIIASNSIRKEIGTICEEKDISVRQGSTLASLIYKGGYNWNKSFGNSVVNCDNSNRIYIGENTIIKILSPNTEKLNQLGEKWLKELNKEKYGFKISDEEIFDDAFEFFMMREKGENRIVESSDISYYCNIASVKSLLESKSKEDKTVTNGSSISFIIEHYGKKLLFLGDSHCELVLKSIISLKKTENYSPYFDIIKVSHHGSSNNTTMNFLKAIDGNNYLISTNGEKYNHPDLDTLAKIVCRSNRIHRTLFFNYPTKASSFFNTYELKNQYNYSVEIAVDGKPMIIDV